MLMARDQYVKVQNLGFLFPFGHLCSLIEVVSREFTESGVAYLMKRSYILVHNPVVEYNDHGFPFRRVEILDDKTPFLSDEREEIGGLGKNAFWPKVGADAKPFAFRILATDWNNQSFTFSLYLPFVMQDTAKNKDYMATVRSLYNSDERRRIDLSGASVAYARPKGEKVSDERQEEVSTSFPTDRLWFMADDTPTSWHSEDLPRFRPRLDKALVHLNQLEGLSNQSAPATVVYFDTYKTWGFEVTHNSNEIYLKLTPPVPTNLPEDALNGMVSPDYKVCYISRRFGAMGPLDEQQAGTQQPDAEQTWGGEKASKIFGIFDLSAILDFEENDDDDFAWIPKFVFEFVTQADDMDDDDEDDQEEKKPGVSLAPEWPPLPPAALNKIIGIKVGFEWEVKGLLVSFPRSFPIFIAYGKDEDEDDQTTIKVSLTKTIKFKDEKEGGGSGSGGGSGGGSGSGGTGGGSGGGTGGGSGGSESGKTGSRLIAGAGGGSGGGSGGKKDDDDDDNGIEFYAGLKNFAIGIPWLSTGETLLGVHFDEIAVTREDGELEVVVGIDGLLFGGPLNFFNEFQRWLMALIPSYNPDDNDGEKPEIEKPPMIDLAIPLPPLPTLWIGIFQLSGIKLGFGLGIPLQKKSGGPEFRFKLSDAEDPFAFTVYAFGGGGYFGIGFTPNRLSYLEAGFEVGLILNIEYAVVKGKAKAAIGFNLRVDFPDKDLNPDLPTAVVQLTGYVRVEGQLKVLGVVEVSILFLLALTYISLNNCLSGADPAEGEDRLLRRQGHLHGQEGLLRRSREERVRPRRRPPHPDAAVA